MGHSCVGMVERQPSRRNCYRSSERAECLGEELRDSDAAVVTRAWPPDVDLEGEVTKQAVCGEVTLSLAAYEACDEN